MFLVQVLVAGSVESEGIYDAVQGILCVFFETRGLLVELFSLIIFVGSCLGEREPRSISLFVGFRAKDFGFSDLTNIGSNVIDSCLNCYSGVFEAMDTAGSRPKDDVSLPKEFINLISSESNEICSKDEKRTIAPEHVLRALEILGFGEYIGEVQAAYEQHKNESLESPKVGGRWAKEGGGGGMTEEEAIAAQQRMFAEARARMNSGGAAAPAAQANDSD
ncbi:uncharacterized protein [Physcomitrium patens]|nr:uncharacterized protein LOC112279508 isoform X2 [Physcomitrium patens]|eukprot:XP_024369784.1 uncharacterized protein LOC112279508 isoform X2 [Physcomitrella patens]